jgi:hypothetical protein
MQTNAAKQCLNQQDESRNDDNKTTAYIFSGGQHTNMKKWKTNDHTAKGIEPARANRTTESHQHSIKAKIGLLLTT